MAADHDISAIVVMADLSISKGDYERSISLLRDALDYAEKAHPWDPKQRLEIMMKLAEVNHIIGNWVDALMYIDNVLQTASEKNLSSIMAEALLASGTILSKKGKWEIAERKFDQAISLAGSGNNHSLVAKALVQKGVILWRKGLGGEAITIARKAASTPGTGDDDELLGSAFALIGSAAFDMGDYPLSLESNGKALAHYRKANKPIEIARVLNNTGETHKLMGDYDKALEFFNMGMKFFGAPSPRGAGYLLTNIAECYARKGKGVDAREYASMAEAKIADVQYDYLPAILSFVWAMISEIEREPGKAEGHYKSALLKMQSLGIPFDTGMIQMAYAEFLSSQDKKEGAIENMAGAAAAFRKAGSLPFAERAERGLESLRA